MNNSLPEFEERFWSSGNEFPSAVSQSAGIANTKDESLFAATFITTITLNPLFC